MTIAAAKTIAPARLNSFRRRIAEPTSSGIPAMTAISPIPELTLLAISSFAGVLRAAAVLSSVFLTLGKGNRQSLVAYRIGYVFGGQCGSWVKKIANVVSNK